MRNDENSSDILSETNIPYNIYPSRWAHMAAKSDCMYVFAPNFQAAYSLGVSSADKHGTGNWPWAYIGIAYSLEYYWHYTSCWPWTY